MLAERGGGGGVKGPKVLACTCEMVSIFCFFKREIVVCPSRGGGGWNRGEARSGQETSLSTISSLSIKGKLRLKHTLWHSGVRYVCVCVS